MVLWLLSFYQIFELSLLFSSFYFIELTLYSKGCQPIFILAGDLCCFFVTGEVDVMKNTRPLVKILTRMFGRWVTVIDRTEYEQQEDEYQRK